jgi:hypothetical protein
MDARDLPEFIIPWRADSRRTGKPIEPVVRRMSGTGLVSRAWPVQTAMRNCTRDEGGPFEVGNQVLTSSHRKLLSSKAMVVLCQEGARAPCCTRDEGGPFGAVL